MRGGGWRLLLFASIGDRRESILAECREIAASGIDRECLPERAAACGEAGNFADLLAHAGIDSPRAAELRAAAEHELRRTLVMRRNAGETISLLTGEGIAVMPLKGADPRIDSLRGMYNPMTDIDLLVTEDACDPAARLLLGNGWRFLGRTSGSHLSFHRPEPDCLLELHWDVVNRANPVHSALFHPPLAAIWERSVVSDGMRLLSPADNAAYLAAHALKEYYHKPKWLADIARVFPAVAFDAHNRSVFDEWGAGQPAGIAAAALGLLYGDTEYLREIQAFMAHGKLERMAARAVVRGDGLRSRRPLFWLAGAGTAGRTSRLGTGALRRLMRNPGGFS